MIVSAHNPLPVTLAGIPERVNFVRLTKNPVRNGLLRLRFGSLRWFDSAIMSGGKYGKARAD